jgi:hypothetical protein
MSQTLSLSGSGTSGLLFDKRLGTNLVAAALIGAGFWFQNRGMRLFCIPDCLRFPVL